MDVNKEQVLFRGLLRPAMIFGVSLDYFTVNILFCLILFIVSAHFILLILILPLHLIGMIACQFDPFIFALITKKCLCMQGNVAKAWGCQCYEP